MNRNVTTAALVVMLGTQNNTRGGSCSKKWAGVPVCLFSAAGATALLRSWSVGVCVCVHGRCWQSTDDAVLMQHCVCT